MRKLLLIILLIGRFDGIAIAQGRTPNDRQILLSSIEKKKQDTAYIEQLLKLSNYYFQDSRRQKVLLDTAFLFAKKGETLSLQLKYARGLGKSYVAESKVFRDKPDIEKGKEFLNKAIAIFKRENYFDLLGDSYHELATYYPITNAVEIKERIQLDELALEAYTQSGDTLRMANGYKEIGDLYIAEGTTSKSLIYLKKALALYKSINYPHMQGIYDLLGVSSSSIGDYTEAIRYGLLAVEMAEAAGDTTSQMATFYNRVGITYNRMDDLKNGLLYFRKGLEFAKRNKDQLAIFLLTLNITRTLTKLGRSQEALLLLQNFVKNNPTAQKEEITIDDCFLKIYCSLRQYSLAEKYYARLDSVLKNGTTQSDYTREFICRAVIQYLLETRQYSQMPYYLALNEKLSTELKMLRNISENHLWWFKLDSAQGKYVSAISHYQQYKKLNDSLFNETKSKQIAQLQVQYESDKKDQDIRLKDQNIELLKKKDQLQLANLQQAKTTRNMVMGSAVLLILLLGLGYNRYRLKQKTNLKLTAQQEEIQRKNETLQHLVTEREWLVKEIHHRVKNNFHIVQGLLGTQSGYLKNEEAVNALADSRHRVQAMSLIHQKLYQSDNLSAINMADYIHELTNYLRESFKNATPLRFVLEVDPVELDLSHCIPLGLIMNEAITNSIKYAFPGNSQGLITIQFRRTAMNLYMLRVTDNGIGLPAHFNGENPATMGMRLMRGLSEDIDASVSINSQAGFGTEVILEFHYDSGESNSLHSKKVELSSTI